MRLVGDHHAADDVLQNASMRVLVRSSTLRERDRFSPWFRRVLVNAAVDFTRRDRAYRRALSQLALERTPEDAPPESDELDCACVHEAIHSLKPEYAGILRKVDLEGASLDEVATTSGITRSNARVRLHRARRALRSRILLVCGGVPSDRCLPCTCKEQSLCKAPR